MNERYYTIKATKINRPVSSISKEFYNSHGVAYEVKEYGKLLREKEFMQTMINAIRNLASDNTKPHNSLTLTLTLEE